jgi:hypothetical protein
MNANASLKCKSDEIITGHINPEIVFKCALVLANSRDDVTIDSILSHKEGGPLYQRGQSWFRSNGLLLLGLVPHLASKLFASFLHVRYGWCL